MITYNFVKDVKDPIITRMDSGMEKRLVATLNLSLPCGEAHLEGIDKLQERIVEAVERMVEGLNKEENQNAS